MTAKKIPSDSLESKPAKAKKAPAKATAVKLITTKKPAKTITSPKVIKAEKAKPLESGNIEPAAVSPKAKKQVTSTPSEALIVKKVPAKKKALPASANPIVEAAPLIAKKTTSRSKKEVLPKQLPVIEPSPVAAAESGDAHHLQESKDFLPKSAPIESSSAVSLPAESSTSMSQLPVPATGTPLGEKSETALIETPSNTLPVAPANRPNERHEHRDHRSHRKDRRFRNRNSDRHDYRSSNHSPRNERHQDAESRHTAGEPIEDIPPENYVPVYEEGIIEVSGKGFGFLRDEKRNFTQSPADTFVTPDVVRNFNLRDGMRIKGEVRKANRGKQLFKLTSIEGEDPALHINRPFFDELTTLNPLELLKLETTPDRYTTRVIDLMCPIGKGQRGLIVAPPRTGKTTILQHIAEAITKNHPELKVIILLIDERPEEVTEIRRAFLTAEVMASSNDSELASHTRIAQLAIARARSLVEMGKDVFLLLDSITRVGRCFNNAQVGKGRTMSGGVDSRALEIPRKLFASARNTEEAGSLTIIATALIETGSRMDDLIFLEFKGTGNMEMVLDRKISDQRVYPAIDIFQSGTRREELLLPKDDLEKISSIRRALAGHKPIEAIERLLFFLKKSPTNSEMLANIPVQP